MGLLPLGGAFLPRRGLPPLGFLHQEGLSPAAAWLLATLPRPRDAFQALQSLLWLQIA